MNEIRLFRTEYFHLWIFLTLLGCLIGYTYTALVYSQVPGSEGSPWLGVATGGMLSALSIGFEISFVSSPTSWFRKLAFIPSFLLRTIIHLLSILLSFLVCQTVYYWLTDVEIFIFQEDLSSTVVDLAFSFAVVSFIVLLTQIRMFIGNRQLVNLVLGKYHKPLSENRVFLFLDIAGSSVAAQKLGDTRFHRYLNHLFVLFDEPIVRSGGEVHSYVGDAIIAVWHLGETPSDNCRVLDAARKILEACDINAESIEAEFGISPRVRMAIHGGPVVVGETGNSKRQITYLGNTVNVAARIEEKAKGLQANVLASDEFLKHCELPASITVQPEGQHHLKGMNEPILLSSIKFQ